MAGEHTMNQPVLLLLHGTAASKAQFNELVPLLSPHFAVHTLDFEGHGSSPERDRPFSIEHFAENVVNYLDSHHLIYSYFFDYIMGGYVALYLALVQPERVT
jgi:pimeloyl-ACP methyl ester carboxylesterase